MEAHNAAMVEESEFLKGRHRREHQPQCSVFSPRSRVPLIRLVKRHGQERGEELSFENEAQRAKAAPLV